MPATPIEQAAGSPIAHATAIDAANFPAWLAAYNAVLTSGQRLTPAQAAERAAAFRASIVINPRGLLSRGDTRA